MKVCKSRTQRHYTASTSQISSPLQLLAQHRVVGVLAPEPGLLADHLCNHQSHVLHHSVPPRPACNRMSRAIQRCLVQFEHSPRSESVPSKDSCFQASKLFRISGAVVCSTRDSSPFSNLQKRFKRRSQSILFAPRVQPVRAVSSRAHQTPSGRVSCMHVPTQRPDGTMRSPSQRLLCSTRRGTHPVRARANTPRLPRAAPISTSRSDPLGTGPALAGRARSPSRPDVRGNLPPRSPPTPPTGARREPTSPPCSTITWRMRRKVTAVPAGNSEASHTASDADIRAHRYPHPLLRTRHHTPARSSPR
jgi:hypothetical protein